MKDVMLDLETLGTKHDAMIVQIGACYFDRMTGAIGDTFIRTIDTSKFDGKFSVDYATVKWWMEQSDEARKSVMAGTDALGWSLTDLADFIGKDTLVWSHATFDMPILVNAFNALELPCPIPFRNMRDLRTLMDLSRADRDFPRREREGVHHNALDDAKYQAGYASDAFSNLNAKEQG